jgi:hypothetical protein
MAGTSPAMTKRAAFQLFVSGYFGGGGFPRFFRGF